MRARPRETGVICNGGLAAASRVRVGGPGAIAIGYVCGSRVEFDTTRENCLRWLIGMSEHE